MIAIDEMGASTYPRMGQAMPKKRQEETRRVMVGVRLAQEDADRLNALHARIPIASRHSIAREALRIGLALLEKDPTRLVKGSVGGAAAKRRPAR